MRSSRRRRLALLGIALGFVAVAQIPSTLAASPSPAPVASGAANPFPDVEAWLDTDFITPDAPPGGVVEAGISFWDTKAHAFAPVGGVYVLLRPAKGDAAPSVGTIRSDFRGHIVAELVVPEGGPGEIEVGVQGRVCTDGGTCTDANMPYAIAGSGPPPEADPATLIDATFHPFVGDIVAGRALPITVDVFPRGLWDLSAVAFPDHLVATAMLRGVDIASAELIREGAPGSAYTGHLTIPEAGAVALAVAVPGNGGEDQVIANATTGVTVIAGGSGPDGGSAAPNDPGDPEPGGDIPLGVWLVGIGALVAVGLVARRVLADL